MPACVLDRVTGDVHRGLVRLAREKLRVDLGGQTRELLDGCGPVDVGAHDQHRLAVALLNKACQFTDGRGLAGTLQTGDQHHRRRTCGEVERLACPHELHKLVVDDLNQRLTGRETREHFLAHGAHAHVFEEILGHRQRHVGLEQRHAHLAQAVAEVVFRQASGATQTLERGAEFLGQVIEHG